MLSNSNNNLKFIINKFYGINLHLIYKAFSSLGLSFSKIYIMNKYFNINKNDFNKLLNFIEKNFIFDILLKDKIFINIRRLRVLNGYKGSRHIYNLPVNGQRTKTNAKTRKKK